MIVSTVTIKRFWLLPGLAPPPDLPPIRLLVEILGMASCSINPGTVKKDNKIITHPTAIHCTLTY